MRASKQCIELIKSFESFRGNPYLCPAGVPTIGYGSTRYADGRAVRMSDIPIDETEAIKILYVTLKGYEDSVNRYVQRMLNQNQFDALVDFTYNEGAKNLRTSTLLKKVNAGDFEGAAAEFSKWIYGNGKKLAGLVRRREAERKLFVLV